jgi:hypothetical protein
MKLFKAFTILTATLALSSCSMNWESGGNEEFKTHCVSKIEMEYFDTKDEVDYDQTCDCLLEKAKSDYDNYEDFLMEMTEFFNAYLVICTTDKK